MMMTNRTTLLVCARGRAGRLRRWRPRAGTEIPDDPSWFAKILALRLNSTILRPEGIEEDLRKTLLYWAGFAGLDVPEPSPALLSEFERIFVKHDRLEFKKVTSARDLHKVANRAALAAVRELLA